MPNVGNLMKCYKMDRNSKFTECKKILQKITKCRCLMHGMLESVEAETTDFFEMIYKLI